MSLKIGKDYSINKRFILRKYIPETSSLIPEIKSPLLDSVNVTREKKKI